MRFALFVCFFLSGFALSAQSLSDSSLRVVPGRTNSAAQEKKPYVIFISADGFRHDLADKYQAKN